MSKFWSPIEFGGGKYFISNDGEVKCQTGLKCATFNAGLNTISQCRAKSKFRALIRPKFSLKK